MKKLTKLHCWMGAILFCSFSSLVATAADTTITLAPGVVVLPPSTTTYTDYTFTLPGISPGSPIPAGKQCRLVFDARLDYPSYSGHTYPIYIRVISASGAVYDTMIGDLLNKEVEFANIGGGEWSWMAGGLWGSLWSPNFNAAAVATPAAGAYQIPDVKHEPYRFAINITSRVIGGANKVRIYNWQGSGASNLILNNPVIEIGDPLPPATSTVTPAPTGPIPTYVASVPVNPTMAVMLNSGGSIRVRIGGVNFDTTSSVSNPGGQPASQTNGSGTWYSVGPGQTRSATWNGTGCRIDRTVKKVGDHIEVDDVVRNQSGVIRGAKITHRLNWPMSLGMPTKATVSGYPAFGAQVYHRSPGNPTSIASWTSPALSMGLVAEDDIFRVHCQSFAEASPGAIGLLDEELVLPVGDVSTNWKRLEWSIYPAANGDYWSTINAIRRNWGSNYQIPGPVVFNGQNGSQSAAYYDNWIDKRGVAWLASGQPVLTTAERDNLYQGQPYKTVYAYGTAVNSALNWKSQIANWTSKVHSLNPGVKMLAYFHGQVSAAPGTFQNPPSYADSKMLDSAGNHQTYPIDAPLREYIATPTNSFGVATKALYESFVTDSILGLDGLNCDEFAWSKSGDTFLNLATNPGVPWDNCTGRIDANGNLLFQYSKTTLVQQAWKTAYLDYMAANDKPTILSGPPETRTIQNKKVPSYCETVNYGEINTTHLSSPLGFGNHEMATNDVARARMSRKMLDRGALQLVWNWPDEPVGQHFIPLMYPITPVELREGMVLGVERLISDRSGVYGWSNGANGTAYVFDGSGRLSTTVVPVKSQVGGAWRWEVRMPSDHMVIVVKD